MGLQNQSVRCAVGSRVGPNVAVKAWLLSSIMPKVWEETVLTAPRPTMVPGKAHMRRVSWFATPEPAARMQVYPAAPSRPPAQALWLQDGAAALLKQQKRQCMTAAPPEPTQLFPQSGVAPPAVDSGTIGELSEQLGQQSPF